MQNIREPEAKLLEQILIEHFNNKPYLNEILCRKKLKAVVDKFLAMIEEEDKLNYSIHSRIIKRIYIEAAEIATLDLKKEFNISQKSLYRYRLEYMKKFKALLKNEYDPDEITY